MRRICFDTSGRVEERAGARACVCVHVPGPHRDDAVPAFSALFADSARNPGGNFRPFSDVVIHTVTDDTVFFLGPRPLDETRAKNLHVKPKARERHGS